MRIASVGAGKVAVKGLDVVIKPDCHFPWRREHPGPIEGGRSGGDVLCRGADTDQANLIFSNPDKEE